MLIVKARAWLVLGASALVLPAVFMVARRHVAGSSCGTPFDLRDAPNDGFGGTDGRDFRFRAGRTEEPGLKGSAQAAPSGPSRAGYVFPEDLVKGEVGGYPGEKYARWGLPSTVLFFIAANHRSPETLELVRRSFADEAALPKAVIIETEPTRPPDYCTTGGGRGSEGCVAKNLAEQKKTAVIFGEYAPPEQLAAIEARGRFSRRDYEGFWLVRTMTGNGNRAAKFDSFDAMFAKLTEEFREEFEVSDGMFRTPDEFSAWYEEGNRKERGSLRRRFKALDPKEAWAAGDLLTQRVLAESLVVKDVHVGRLIAGAAAEFGSVLVIYGGAHYEDLRPALDQMLGPPREIGR